MGMDAFVGFTHWHQWQSILELCNLIVVTRPGTTMFGQDEAMFGKPHGLLQDRLITESDSLKQRQHGQILLHPLSCWIFLLLRYENYWVGGKVFNTYYLIT